MRIAHLAETGLKPTLEKELRQFVQQLFETEPIQW